MQLYASINSTDEFHNMQFILQAPSVSSGVTKANMVAEYYHSGYDIDSITVMTRPDVHTIKEIDQCRVTASSRGVYGRVGVRTARTMVGGYGNTFIVNLACRR